LSAVALLVDEARVVQWPGAFELARGRLEFTRARLEGDIGRLKSDLVRSIGAIGESELRLLRSDKEYSQQVVDDLKKVQAAPAEQEESRTQLADRLGRIEIRAPHGGHNEGGVIQPGSTILQIIPGGEKRIVEAQVQPQDIDMLHKEATSRPPHARS